MKALTVYYVPTCAFSAAAVSFLLLRGADFDLVNLDEHPYERARLEDELDGAKLETPLLAAADDLHVAPSLAELKELLVEWKLPERASPYAQLHS
jgi:glutaredoxin